MANVKAFLIGKANYHLKNPKVEAKARERAEVCAQCEHNIKEPIKMYQIEDDIESISKRTCSVCSCLLPYLLRQNKKPCELGKWK